MTYQSYPLSWPVGIPRTPAAARETARFSGSVNGKKGLKRQLTVAEGWKRVHEQLDMYTKVGQSVRINLDTVIVSTNVPTRNDGLPRSGLSEPADVGVAVYFELDGKPYCLPCDHYDRVADNLAAVAAHLEATRTIERHHVGTAHNVFSDFKALPSGDKPWWEVLGVSEQATITRINEAYRQLARRWHPDVMGGSHELFIALVLARDQGIATRQHDS